MTSPTPPADGPPPQVNAPINGYTIMVAVVAALGGLLFGFDTGVISGAMLYIEPYFDLKDAPNTVGWIVAGVVLGAIFGSAVGGKLADAVGRRRLVIITAVMFALGSLGCAYAPAVEWLIAGRVFLGLAIGVASCVAPLYISEMAPPQIRGGLVSLNQLMITIGIVFSYAVDYGFSVLEENGTLTAGQAWGWMLGFGAIPAVVLGVGMMLLPDSPRWLAAKGRRADAERTLKKIRGTEDVSGEMAEIDESLKEASEESKSDWSELARPWLRPLLIVGIGLGIFQQFSGINTVIYYAPTIFKMAGYESDSVAILATAGVGLLNVIMTVVAVFLMDRVGRRPLLLIGLTGMCISLIALGGAFYANPPDAAGQVTGTALPIICLASLLLYVGSFAISLGPIFWLLISEIYPTKIRGLAMGLATMIQWGANLAVTQSFPNLIATLDPFGTFWLFGGLCVAALLFSYILMPETKGVTLEEIEEHCRAGKPLGALGKG
ncbi:MAG: sugar porter family MFS transporter [Verrucomicrobiota bacterium]